MGGGTDSRRGPTLREACNLGERAWERAHGHLLCCGYRKRFMDFQVTPIGPTEEDKANTNTLSICQTQSCLTESPFHSRYMKKSIADGLDNSCSTIQKSHLQNLELPSGEVTHSPLLSNLVWIRSLVNIKRKAESLYNE